MSQTSPLPGPHLLIRSITPAGGQALEVGTITVLVGPGNAGKSETLRDIARLAGNFDPAGAARVAGEEPRTRVIQDVTLIPRLGIDRLLRGIAAQDGGAGGSPVASGLGPDLRTPYRRNVTPDMKHVLSRPALTARSIATTALGEIMPLRVAYLSADDRTALVEPAGAASPLRPPENLLQAFQLASDAAGPFDEAISQLCDGRHACLDATERVSLCLRVAAEIPPLTGDFVQDALRFAALPRLDQQGDSWKSCAAVILAFLVWRVILLDQPEAHLQPDQARRLGAWIAEHAAKLGTQVFVATRDPSFLEGLFAGGADVSLLRLTRRDDNTRFELVPPDVGKALAAFPLLAAQRAIHCLFQDGVVVVRDEPDRIVYQTVAARVLRAWNVGFLHAQGPRNLAFMARILRRANLPTCVVAELDVFQAQQGFVELVKAMGAIDAPSPWLATRDRLASHVEGWFDEHELTHSASEVESFLDQLKKGGVAAADAPAARPGPPSTQAKWDRLRREQLAGLPAALRVWVEELIEELKRIGIFVSPKGRLQGWVEGAAAEDRENWFTRIVQALDRRECPPDMRAFVAEITAFVRAAAPK
jgi:hypothetical protein